MFAACRAILMLAVFLCLELPAFAAAREGIPGRRIGGGTRFVQVYTGLAVIADPIKVGFFQPLHQGHHAGIAAIGATSA